MKVIRVSKVNKTKVWQRLIQYLRDGGKDDAFGLFARAQTSSKQTFTPVEEAKLKKDCWYIVVDGNAVRLALGNALLDDEAVQLAIAKWNAIKVIRVLDIPRNDEWRRLLAHLQQDEERDALSLYAAAQDSCKQIAVPVQKAKLRKNIRYLVLVPGSVFLAKGGTLLEQESVTSAIANYEACQQDTVGLAVATYHVRRVLEEENELSQKEDSDARVVCKRCKKRRRRSVTEYGLMCDLCHEAALENDQPGVLEAATRKVIDEVQSDADGWIGYWSSVMGQDSDIRLAHHGCVVQGRRLHYAVEIVHQRKNPPPAKKTPPKPEKLEYSGHVPKFKADYDFPRGIAGFWSFKEQKAFYDAVAASLDDRAFPDVQDQYDYVYHYARKLVRDWNPNRELQELHDRLTAIAEAYPNAEELLQACVAWKTEIETSRTYSDIHTYLGGIGIHSHRDASAHMSSLERDRYFHELHDKLLEIAEKQLEDRKLVDACFNLRLDCLLELGRFEDFLALSSPQCPKSPYVPQGEAMRRLLVQQQAGLEANALDLFSLVCASVNPTTLDNWDKFKKLLKDVFTENAAQNGPWFERILRAFKDEKGLRARRVETGLQFGDHNFEGDLVDAIYDLYGFKEATNWSPSRIESPARSLASEIRACGRVAENRLRDELGLPQVGAGWVAETKLFQAIAEAFPETTVLQHGSPDWLGIQHFDVWIPDWRIAVEYHGLQHFQPVDFFGGEEVFIANQERDARKIRLAKENAVELIVATEQTPTEDVIELIRQHRSGIKSG